METGDGGEGDRFLLPATGRRWMGLLGGLGDGEERDECDADRPLTCVGGERERLREPERWGALKASWRFWKLFLFALVPR